MGVTWQEFWGMNPHIINCVRRGHEEKIKQDDYLQHVWWGNYGISAISVAVEHCLAGDKAKTKYIEKAVLKEAIENAAITEEEIYERELQKALLAEERWIAVGKLKGLPETII